MENYAQLNTIDLNNYPILMQNKHHDSLTDKYATIPTIKPLNVLQDHGWRPRQFIELKARKEHRKGYQTHRVRLFNPTLPIVNGSFLELLLTNSYDGTSSFQIQLGVFRRVCANGLVTGDMYNTERVKHIGYTDTKIAQSITNILPQADKIASSIDQWSNIQLTLPEQNILAKSAIEMRVEDATYQINDRAITSILQPSRYADNKSDLWTIFNRLQENTLRHGFRAQKLGEYRSKKVRAINNMKEQDRLNKTLWTLSDEMAKIKLAA